MGPALMDDTWLYGSEPAQVFASIAQGRPNGMPTFGDKIQEAQIWQLVAYVRSLSGLVNKQVEPARSDEMRDRFRPIHRTAGAEKLRAAEIVRIDQCRLDFFPMTRPCIQSSQTLLQGPTLLADGNMQSALDPAGVQAHSISKLWWGFFWVTAVVYVLVIVFMFAGNLSPAAGGDDPSEPPIVSPDRMAERRMTFTVGKRNGNHCRHHVRAADLRFCHRPRRFTAPPIPIQSKSPSPGINGGGRWNTSAAAPAPT